MTDKVKQLIIGAGLVFIATMLQFSNVSPEVILPVFLVLLCVWIYILNEEKEKRMLQEKREAK